MKKFIILTIILIFIFSIFLIPFTSPAIQNQLNDTSTSKNFSGIGNWSNLTYIRLPKTATITSAALNLTGFRSTEIFEDTINTITFDNTTGLNDTYVSESAPDTNQNVGTPNAKKLESKGSSVGSQEDIYIHFDLSTLPLNINVTEGNLSLWYFDGTNNGDGAILDMYNVTSSWGASEITWNNRPTRDTAILSSTDIPDTGAAEKVWVNFSMTNLVQFWVDSPSNNYGFVLINNDGANLETRKFNSSDVLGFPYLTINYQLGSFPSNVTLQVNNSFVFNHTGEFSTENQTIDFSGNVTEFLDGCTADANGFCDLPLNISGTNGIVQISDINITYTTTPSLSITTPLNNSNHSTNNFNINYTFTNFTALDTCKWTEDLGATNTSLASCGINITGETWDEGTTTVTIHINNTDNVVNSSSVTFYVETLENITFCRDLDLANTVYNLTKSVSTDGTCMNVLENNITLNCEGRSITGDGGLADRGISSNGFDNFKMNDCLIKNFGNNLYFEDSKNNTIRNSNLTSSPKWSIFLVTNSVNTSIFNTTYLNINESVGGGSELFRYWDYRAFVNDTEGNNVSTASVNIRNITGTSVATDTTGADGLTSINTLLSYVNNAGTKTESNNHTITVTNSSNPPYFVSGENFTINLTLEESTYFDVLTITFDNTNPLISFGDGTEVDFENKSQSNIYVNVTWTETNFNNITFSLYNDTNTVNSTTFTASTFLINWTNLDENNYTYEVNITDKSNNKNSTGLRNIRLDRTSPFIVISAPTQSQTLASNSSINLNFSVVDDFLEISSCIFNVINITGKFVVLNTTITNCQNTTFNITQGSGDYFLRFYANDSVNNLNSTSRNFSISLLAPAVNLINPSNNAFLNSFTNVIFNYTAEDTNGVDTCEFFHNASGTFSKNLTNVHGGDTSVTASEGNFSQNFSEGPITWNVRCNDTLNEFAFASTNFTVTFDTIIPLVSITSPANDSTSDSLALTIEYNISDTNIDNCFFTLRNESGQVHNFPENTSIACTETGSRSISVLETGTYTFTLTGRDKAQNENSSILTFNIISPITPPAPSGGGGGGLPEQKIPVITLLGINVSKEYSELDRAIIFAKINSFCSEKETGETLAIADFSGECQLTLTEIDLISVEIGSTGLQVPQEDLVSFFKLFQEKELEQGFATEKEIKEFNLFSSILGNVQPFTIFPSSISSPVFRLTFEDNITIEQTFTSNRPVKSCELIERNGRTDLLVNCTIISENLFQTSFVIKETDFFNKNFDAEFSIVSLDTPEFTEVRALSINYNVFNFQKKFADIPVWIWIAGILVILIVTIIVLTRNKRFRKLFKKKK